MAITLLSYLLSIHQGRQAEVIIKKIFAENVLDPVGLWFSGILKMGDKNQKPLARRSEEAKQALHQGINRYLLLKRIIQKIRKSLRKDIKGLELKTLYTFMIIR